VPKDETSLSSIHEEREEEREAERRWQSSQRRHRFLSAAVILLTAVIAGLTWYAYPLLTNQGASLARLSGIEPLVNALGVELKNSDSKLADLSKNHEDLRQQMDKLGHELRARLVSAKQQTSDATAAMMRNIETELEAQTSKLRDQIASLESTRDTDRRRIGSVQQDLNQLRAEVARQAEELAATRRQMDGNRSSTDQQLADLQESERRNRTDVDQIANNLAVERVSFEVSKGHSQELAPGISLKLTGTDVSFHRVSGWMWVMPDRRTIWLQSQSVQEPVVFYGLEDGKKRELVITQVARNSAVGYLILPKAAQANPAAAATSE
jgi:predicted  nucleic acid-binding Zn-ribbon protein